MNENYTVIDNDNYKDSGVEFIFFPGGEPHIKVPIFTGNILLFLKIRNWNDVAFASLAMDAVSRQQSLDKLSIFIPYFPAARQDRVTDGKSALTLFITGRMLHTYAGIVSAFDAHSPQIWNYTEVNRNYLPVDLDIPLKKNVAGIIAPDKGAVERATVFRDRFYPQAHVILCEKSRNPATGALSGYTMSKLEKVGHYIIVDDICDGGGTFNLLVDAFNKNEIAERSTLELFVSHGIFSKGLGALHPKISHITTTNSWCKMQNSERLTVLKLETLFDKITGTIHA